MKLVGARFKTKKRRWLFKPEAADLWMSCHGISWAFMGWETDRKSSCKRTLLRSNIYKKLRLAQENPEPKIFFGSLESTGEVFLCVWGSLKATVKRWSLRLETVSLHPEQSFISFCGLLLTVFSTSLIYSKDLQGSLAKQHTPEGYVLIRNFLILQLICWVISGNLYVSLFWCVALSIHTLVSFPN